MREIELFVRVNWTKWFSDSNRSVHRTLTNPAGQTRVRLPIDIYIYAFMRLPTN